jgi:tRNA threonylcarbamoyladenosine dehydratase
VYSDEQMIKPDALQTSSCMVSGDGENNENNSITGLNCAGYGSSVCVTAPFGFAAASLAFQQLLITK